MLGVLTNVSKNLVGLSDFTKSEGGKTDLNQSTVVHNLVLDWLHSDNLGHTSLHHHVSGLTEFVMKREVVYLLQSDSHTLFGQTPSLDDIS